MPQIWMDTNPTPISLSMWKTIHCCHVFSCPKGALPSTRHAIHQFLCPFVSSTTSSTYRRHEREKREAYEQRILEVEHRIFTPLVLSSSGGWGPLSMVVFKRLTGLTATKHVQSYSATLSFIRCKIGYSLIQTRMMRLRGPRSSFHAPTKAISLEEHPLDLICQEVRLF